VIVRKFHRRDLESLPLQERQRWAAGLVTDEAFALMESGPSYTLDDNGPQACAGLIYGEDVPVAWAWIAEGAPMLALHRYVQAALAAVPVCMAHADLGWANAVKWLEMLGFRPTGEVITLGGVSHGTFLRYG